MKKKKSYGDNSIRGFSVIFFFWSFIYTLAVFPPFLVAHLSNKHTDDRLRKREIRRRERREHKGDKRVGGGKGGETGEK